jgi:hypothetical protein
LKSLQKRAFFAPKQSFIEILGKVKPYPLLWGSQYTVKTFFAIALNCVYLTLAVGVAKTTHYCMGRENHTSHFSFNVDPCACFKFMGGASDCCQNESVLLQVDDEQSASVQLSIQPVQLPLLFEFVYAVDEVPEQSFSNEFSPEKFLRPPPLKAYIKNCSLVLYEEEIVSLS